MITIYGSEGAFTKEVLTQQLPKYKLHFQEVNEINAKHAILRGRPCIFTFYLDEYGWAKFSKFYNDVNTQGKILTKEIFDSYNIEPEEEGGSHAVVFIRYNSCYMEFLNSWGSNWNKNGFFKIGDLKIFQSYKFYDVFWYESDLTLEDKKNWENRNIELIQNNLSKELLFNYPVKCPHCNQISKASQFNGNLAIAVCPLCQKQFVPNIEQLSKTLYLKQV